MAAMMVVSLKVVVMKDELTVVRQLVLHHNHLHHNHQHNHHRSLQHNVLHHPKKKPADGAWSWVLNSDLIKKATLFSSEILKTTIFKNLETTLF
jgi:hypothetical protein